MKFALKSILKRGAKLRTRKLNPKDPELVRHINDTIAAQNRTLSALVVDKEQLRRMVVTI